MRKYFIIAGVNCLIIVGIFFIFSWLISSAYNALKYKPYQIDKLRVLTGLKEIDRSIENNEGKMDLDNVTERDDWDRFCLVMAYLATEKELKKFISDPSSIDKFLPDNNDDGFGLGVLFVQNKEIIDSIHFPRGSAVPASSDAVEFAKSISDVSANGKFIAPPRLDPKFGKSNESPRVTCYTREYTIKIHKDWEYSIVKKENHDE